MSAPAEPRVVLGCWGNIATGVGSEARRLYKLLPLKTWLQHSHPKLRYGPDIERESGKAVVRGHRWRVFETHDVMLSIERPIPREALDEGRRFQLKNVVISNPEWTAPRQNWHGLVHRWIARTEQGLEHLGALGYGELAVFADVPLDLAELPFTPRTSGERVVFTNGWGGIHERKGLPEIQAMLSMRRGGLTVYSQRPIPGVEHVGEVGSAAELYQGADIVVMPSRFEGVGLTLLEAMAAGALCVATDAAPMSEFVRRAFGSEAERFLLPVQRTSNVIVANQAWRAHHVHPAAAWDRIDALRSLPAEDIERLSRMGRAYVEEHHGRKAVDTLWRAISVWD